MTKSVDTIEIVEIDEDRLILETNEEPLAKKKETRGRKKGTFTCSHNRWKITMFDKTTNKMITGKYTSVNAINEALNLKLNSDYVMRIMTHYRVSENSRLKEKSFMAKWGHIQIEKIYEPIEPICVYL